MILHNSRCFFEKLEAFEKRPPVLMLQGLKASDFVNLYSRAQDFNSKRLKGGRGSEKGDVAQTATAVPPPRPGASSTIKATGSTAPDAPSEDRSGTRPGQDRAGRPG